MISSSQVAGGGLSQWRMGTTRFLRWWWSELALMLPSGLRARFRGVDRRIELRTNGNAIHVLALDRDAAVLNRELALESGELEEVLAQATRELGQEVEPVLRLQAPESLVREIRLPDAAGENLGQVLRYEMDRFTPFSADTVYYGFRILGQAPNNTIRVQLAVVLRQRLDQWLSRLRARGIYPRRVVADGAPDIDLAPATSGAARHRGRNTVKVFLAGAVVLALIVVFALPLWVLRDTATQLVHEAGHMRNVALDAEQLRDARNALEHQTRYLVSRKQDQPSVLRSLEELTAILPDDTWVRDLQKRGDRIVIQGLSGSASGLIERIESSPFFGDVSFAAPVTADPRSGNDSYQIELHVRPVRP